MVVSGSARNNASERCVRACKNEIARCARERKRNREMRTGKKEWKLTGARERKNEIERCARKEKRELRGAHVKERKEEEGARERIN